MRQVRPQPLLYAELTHAAARLRRTPVFTFAAILVVGLGVGVGAAAFSYLNGLYLKPLAEGRGLVRLLTMPASGAQGPLRAADVSRLLADPPQLLTTIAGYGGRQRQASTGTTAIIDGVSKRVAVEGITDTYFDVFDATPIAGRLLGSADNGALTSVISERLWRREFGASPDVIGRSIVVAGQTLTIVGVVAAPFLGPWPGGKDVWVPAHIIPVEALVGRLDDSVRLEQLNAELRGRYSHPADDAGLAFVAMRGLMPSLSDLGMRGYMLLGSILAIGFLVSIVAACSAALMLIARLSSRQGEMAIRLALGATARDLARPVAWEIGFIALAGTLLAVLVAAWLSHLVVDDFIRSSGLSMTFDATPDWRLIVYIAIATSVIAFGLVARMSWAVQGYVALSSMAAAGGIGGSTLRTAGTPTYLVMGQTAITTALLLVASMLAYSAIAGMGFTAGLDMDRVTVAWIDQTPHLDARAPAVLEARRVLDVARTTPGVQHAAVVSRLPGGALQAAVGVSPHAGPHVSASLQQVTPDAFRVLDLPLRSGRTFSEAEDRDADAVVVVSESLADQFWPGLDPIGQHIRILFRDHSSELLVIGVVGNIDPRLPHLRRPRDIYVPLGRNDSTDNRRLAVAVRAADDNAGMVERLRAHLQQALPSTGLIAVVPARHEFDQLMAPAAFVSRVAGLLGLSALVVASIGLYGLTAYLATQRRSELAIRQALGATSGKICGMLAVEASRPLAIGIAAGVVAGLFMRSVLPFFTMTTGDGMVVVFVAGVLFATGILGSLLPFVQSMRGATEHLRELRS